MSNKTPKSLSELIFREGGRLGELARRASGQADLAAALRGALPPELADGVRSASLQEDGTLVILAGSPAWAARLRFEEKTVLGLCARHEPPVRRLKVRVSGPA